MFRNSAVNCNSIEDMDLTYWTEAGSCTMNGVSFPLGHTRRITPCVSCTCTSYGVQSFYDKSLLSRPLLQPECQAIRVVDCRSLLSDYELSDILLDAACSIQCSHALRSKQSLP
ncbi:unnamed protein product [Soboliphyme baturini]|uniref:Uncharacterized protein n=1 Tax=Soboliphyme baturini TaxID=241478 RepID=A0A183IJ38_9BILA|nr:unnamed protein product [Soboliphyme baturini]